MVTLLIADDEKKVCQLITKLIDWGKLGIDLIGTYTNGEDALDNIIKYKPDIVLTDIRMPIYNGLELVELAQKEGIDSSFIIISGYKEFEYAQKALKFGVIDFIVKPINKEMLNLTLEKTCNKIRSKKNILYEVSQVNKLREERLIKLKEELFTELINKNSNIDNKIENISKTCELKFKTGIYQAILISTDEISLHESQSMFSDKVIEYMKPILKKCYEYIVSSRKEGIYCVLNYDFSYENFINSDFKILYEQILQIQEVYGAFCLTIGIGKKVDCISKVYESIYDCRQAEQSKLVSEETGIIRYDKNKYKEYFLSDFFTKNEEEELNNFIELFKIKEMKDFIYEIEEKIVHKNDISSDVILEIRDNLVKIFLSQTKINDESTLNQISDMIEKSKRINSIYSFFSLISGTFENILLKVYDEKMDKERMPIKKAKEYILNNYKSSLSLEDVAKEIGFSPVYFSKLFKKIEGMNYIDYLTKVRMNSAKNLISDTNLSIDNIAIEIGYTDVKYFRKLFKKLYGIKPIEYRKLYSK